MAWLYAFFDLLRSECASCISIHLSFHPSSFRNVEAIARKPQIELKGVESLKARQLRAYALVLIEQDRFRLSEMFPEYWARHHARVPASAQTCADVFEAFVTHLQAQCARDELTHETVTEYWRILNRHWRAALGTQPSLSVTYSQLVAHTDAVAWSAKTYNNALAVLKAPSPSAAAITRAFTIQRSH